MPEKTDLAEWLTKMKTWEKDENGRIVRKLQFNNFVEAFAFLYKVSVEAEKMDHHPDFSLFSYNKVTIVLYTHSKNAVTENDMIMAEKIESLTGSI